MEKEIVRESFILHSEWIEDLPEEYKGKFLRIIYEYGIFGTEPELDGLERTVWLKIQKRIDNDQKLYDQRVNALANARKKTLESKKGKTESENPVSHGNCENTENENPVSYGNAKNEIPCVTEIENSQSRDSVYVSVSDSVSDSDSDSVSVPEGGERHPAGERFEKNKKKVREKEPQGGEDRESVREKAEMTKPMVCPECGSYTRPSFVAKSGVIYAKCSCESCAGYWQYHDKERRWRKGKPKATQEAAS